MGQECSILIRRWGAPTAQDDCWLPAVSLPPARLSSQASLQARHQQTGPRPFYVSIYCPKWGGASCPGLKGPEAGRLRAQWEVCVWRLVGVGIRRSWGSHLSPNSWVGLRPTLFPRSECCRGPGSTASTPRPASKRKPCEDRAILSGGGRNKLPVTGGNQSQASQNPIRVYTALNSGCTCLSKMPRRGLGDFHPDCSLPPLRPACHLEVPVPPPAPPTA